MAANGQGRSYNYSEKTQVNFYTDPSFGLLNRTRMNIWAA